jgi:ribosome-binding protein aMBF1 (putative translation factor)
MNMVNKQLNRTKVVLADKQRTNKWLAEQLGKDKTTVSKWRTNSSQPDLESLMKTAKLLGVEVAELLRNENVE